MPNKSHDHADSSGNHLYEIDDDKLSNELEPYAGRWIATIDGKVVAQGGTPTQALQAAGATRYKEIPQVSYVPTTETFTISSVLENINPVLPPDVPIYLVGGAVRDVFLKHRAKELDFVLDGDAIKVGRKVANELGAAFYPLDESRNAARVIFYQPDGQRLILDFSVFRGPDLESDLRARDFTINAMAVDVKHMENLLDPMGGIADLRAKRLRACSGSTFYDDPIRILRGIRFAAEIDLRITPDTLQQMREAVGELHRSSPERIRNELMRIMVGPRIGSAIRALDMLGVFKFILPELPQLKGLEQSAPHIYDVWEHTLNTLIKLEHLLSVLAPDYKPEGAQNLMTGLVSVELGRYRERIYTHLEEYLTPDVPALGLLFLAALYHDIGKPQTIQLDENGQVRFFNHENIGAEIMAKRAIDLRFSNQEVARMKKIVRHHLRPIWLAQTGKSPSKMAIYRFFRDTGEAGVDICLLSLADVWATHGPTLSQEIWTRHLEVVRMLLDAWWELKTERVSPPVLVTGNDLIDELNLRPGPTIGVLLERIREAQIEGDVNNKSDALIFARNLLRSEEY